MSRNPVKDKVEGSLGRGVNEPGTELTQKSGNGKLARKIRKLLNIGPKSLDLPWRQETTNSL